MKWMIFAGLFALLLAACTSQRGSVEPAAELPTPVPAKPALHLPDLGAAPEIENEVWVNADAPVTLASQRGKVVLLEFWTFG
ncbi:MAG: hypothetical protein KC423_18570 [Anaerolineales bacterium]|nr:hypothetical protein [Anaerolineales bacterium]MCB9434409.1 hypothetical protein [Ardenticatenaceae bacterium]